MLILILLAVLTVAFGLISYVLFNAIYNEIISVITFLLAVAFGVCFAVFGAIALSYRMGYMADIISAETRYQGIIHQIETVKYTDDIAKERLYEQIIAWNQEVERGKVVLANPWLSWSTSPVYNELQCIEYPDWQDR